MIWLMQIQCIIAAMEAGEIIILVVNEGLWYRRKLGV